MIFVAVGVPRMVAAVIPKCTAEIPVKLVPVIVTVPPASAPVFGETAVIAGIAMYVKRSAVVVADEPSPRMTCTSTSPAACGGMLAVMLEFELTVTEVDATVPNRTPEASVNPLPLINTLVLPPPAAVHPQPSATSAKRPPTSTNQPAAQLQ